MQSNLRDPWHKTGYYQQVLGLIFVVPFLTIVQLTLVIKGLNGWNLVLTPVCIVAAIWVAVVVHELGHLLAMKKRNVAAELFIVPGLTYDFGTRKMRFFRRNPFRTLGAVTLQEEIKDMFAWRDIVVAGNRANGIVGVSLTVLLAVMNLFPAVMWLAPTLGHVAFWSILFGLINRPAMRVSAAIVTDSYWKRLIDLDPTAAARHLRGSFALRKFMENRPRDHAPEELPDTMEEPFFNAVFQYSVASDQNEHNRAGIILERALQLPAGNAPTVGQFCLLQQAAFHFVRYVDDRDRAEAYARQLRDSMLQGEASLLAFHIAVATRDGEHKRANQLIKAALKSFPDNPEKAWMREEIQNFSEPSKPISKEEWAAYLREHLNADRDGNAAGSSARAGA